MFITFSCVCCFKYLMSLSHWIYIWLENNTRASAIVFQTKLTRYCLFGLFIVEWVMVWSWRLSFPTVNTVMNGSLNGRFFKKSMLIYFLSLLKPQDTGIVTMAAFVIYSLIMCLHIVFHCTHCTTLFFYNLYVFVHSWLLFLAIHLMVQYSRCHCPLGDDFNRWFHCSG